MLVQYAVASLIPLLLLPHIVRSIGLAEYGQIAVMLAWGSYGGFIVQYAFNMTGPKRLGSLSDTETESEVFARITLAKIVLLLIVLLIMSVFAVCFFSTHQDNQASLILLYAVPIAMCLNSVWFLQVKDKFGSVLIMSTLGSLLTLFIGFSFIGRDNPDSEFFAVVVSFSGALIVGIGTLLLSLPEIDVNKSFIRLSAALSELKEGWHLFISQLVSLFYAASGPIVINALIGAKAAGAYSVTERVIVAVMAAAMLTYKAGYPRLAFAYQNDRKGYWNLLKFILLSYSAITITVAILAWSLRDMVVGFLYDDSTSSYELLLLSGIGWLLLGVYGTALTGHLSLSGRNEKILPLTLMILVLSFSLGIPGILIYGSAGWLTALVCSQVVVFITGFRCWRKEYGT